MHDLERVGSRDEEKQQRERSRRARRRGKEIVYLGVAGKSIVCEWLQALANEKMRPLLGFINQDLAFSRSKTRQLWDKAIANGPKKAILTHS
jgi:hypothetical protein